MYKGKVGRATLGGSRSYTEFLISALHRLKSINAVVNTPLSFLTWCVDIGLRNQACAHYVFGNHSARKQHVKEHKTVHND